MVFISILDHLDPLLSTVCPPPLLLSSLPPSCSLSSLSFPVSLHYIITHLHHPHHPPHPLDPNLDPCFHYTWSLYWNNEGVYSLSILRLAFVRLSPFISHHSQSHGIMFWITSGTYTLVTSLSSHYPLLLLYLVFMSLFLICLYLLIWSSLGLPHTSISPVCISFWISVWICSQVYFIHHYTPWSLVWSSYSLTTQLSLWVFWFTVYAGGHLSWIHILDPSSGPLIFISNIWDLRSLAFPFLPG